MDLKDENYLITVFIYLILNIFLLTFILILETQNNKKTNNNNNSGSLMGIDLKLTTNQADSYITGLLKHLPRIRTIPN